MYGNKIILGVRLNFIGTYKIYFEKCSSGNTNYVFYFFNPEWRREFENGKNNLGDPRGVFVCLFGWDFFWLCVCVFVCMFYFSGFQTGLQTMLAACKAKPLPLCYRLVPGDPSFYNLELYNSR